MRIMLTGATGFLGSYVLKRLLQEQYTVSVIKRSFSNCTRVGEELKRCACYDLDKIDIQEIMRECRPDVIIHCATDYGKRSETEKVIQSNLLFPVALLQAAIQFGTAFFINTDSFFSKQVEERLSIGKKMFRADYSLSKYQFCQWGRLAVTEQKISFINLQMEHVCGPGDDPQSKFYPFLIQQMSEGVKSIDITDGMQIRDFIHVEYAAEAYITILQNLHKLAGFHSFEVGTGVSHTVRELAEMIKRDLNAGTVLNFGAVPRADTEIMYSTADPHGLRELGWNAPDVLFSGGGIPQELD